MRKVSPRPVVEVLEPRLMLSVSADVAALMSNAQTLNLLPRHSVSTTGMVNSPEQSQAYCFTAGATGDVVVKMNASRSRLDSFVQVFDDQGNLVGQNDNASTRTLGSMLDFVAEKGETYYVRAAGQNGTTGRFGMKLASTTVDDYGDTLDTAKPLSMNSKGILSASGGIQFAGDVDMFSVVAVKTGTMTVVLSPNRGNLSAGLVAYNATGAVLAQDTDTSNTSAKVTFAVTAGQTYFLQAEGVRNTFGNYKLTASTANPPPPPTPEPTPTPTPEPTPTPTPEPTPTPTPEPTPTPTPEPTPTPTPTPTYVPGTSVAGQIVQLTGGLQLVVLGTDGADTITLTQTTDGFTMTTAYSSTNFTGAFTSLMIYGFGGDDTLRVTNGVTGDVTVYGGDGNDSIYEAGQGAATVYGDAGDDLLVTVGGGADKAYGGDGSDSFWVDSADTVADASSAETAATAVHKISSFYVPATNGSGPVSMEIAGQNLADPLTGYGYANFAGRSLFVDGPQYNDIAQGSMGDCYFMAALASLADTDPGLIRQMIISLGDGTFAVRFYSGGKAVYVRVDADLPVYSGTSPAYARLSPSGETWVALAEKAYAEFRCSDNNYASLNGGWMGSVYYNVTNVASNDPMMGSASWAAQFISTQLAAGHAVTAATVGSPGSPLYGGHAYMVKSVETVSGDTFVTVYNPWGTDGNGSYDSNPSDGLLRLTLAQFQASFMALSAAQV